MKLLFAITVIVFCSCAIALSQGNDRAILEKFFESNMKNEHLRDEVLTKVLDPNTKKDNFKLANWVASQQYYVGELVARNGKHYECQTDNSGIAPESSPNGEWAETEQGLTPWVTIEGITIDDTSWNLGDFWSVDKVSTSLKIEVDTTGRIIANSHIRFINCNFSCFSLSTLSVTNRLLF